MSSLFLSVKRAKQITVCGQGDHLRPETPVWHLDNNTQKVIHRNFLEDKVSVDFFLLFFSLQMIT